MSVDVVLRLQKEHANFIGYKEMSLLKMGKILNLKGDRLSLVTEDWVFTPALALGATSVASVAANIFPKMMVDIYDGVLDGNFEKARNMQTKLIPLMEMLGIGAGGRETNPVPIKAAMDILGLTGGKPRLPLVPASPETVSELKVMLAKIIPSMSIA